MTYLRSSPILWACSIACLVFQGLHLYQLPLLISYDSQLYLDLANVLLTDRFPKDWDFLRTPLYPLGLKITQGILGQNAFSVLLLSTVFGLAGLLILVSFTRNRLTDYGAGLAVLIVSVCPWFVVYQHSALSEMGSFFFLALFAWMLWRTGIKSNFSWPGVWYTTGIVVAAYYYRPTLLYLGPFAAACLLICRLGTGSKSPQHIWLKAGAFIFVPIILAYPWAQKNKESGREASQIAFGIVNQALIHPESPHLGDLKPMYQKALADSLVDGKLSVSGINDGLVYAPAGRLHQIYQDKTKDLFWRLIFEDPARYLAGVARGFLFLIGLKGIDTDTGIFAILVFRDSANGTQILPGPAHLDQAIRQKYGVPGGRRWLGRIMFKLYEPFRAVLVIGFIAATIISLIGLLKRDLELIILGGIPLSFVGLHAGILFSLDRMASPAQPFALFCFVYLLVMLARLLTSKTANTSQNISN